jgi:hypothetical protein
MKRFFHAHPDITIVTLAAVFLAALATCYLWAINDIYAEIHQALASSITQSSDAFDLASAANLDLRGLVNASSVAPGADIASSSAAITPDTSAASSSATSSASGNATSSAGGGADSASTTPSSTAP